MIRSKTLDRLGAYLNPIKQLGNTHYSAVFPLITMVSLMVLTEIWAYLIVGDPNSITFIAIFGFAAFIIYFAFHDGLTGGLLAVVLTVLYYGYVIISRSYTGNQLISAIETALLLATLYLVIAVIIGWLKETIDGLIQKEKEARSAAEEGKLRLETILEQLPVGVLLADLELNVVGNKKIKEILGRKIESKLQAEVKSGSWPISRALLKGETVAAEEIEYRTTDDRQLFLRVNAAPIKNHRGRVMAAVSTIYDISQIKELDRRKDDFVNMASHELKTPLTSIKLYLDLLQKNLRGSKNRMVTKGLINLKMQADRLQSLVNDLLDVSRIQTGKLRFQKEHFRLDTLILETGEVLQATTEQHQLEFKIKKKVTVYADRFRIYQVLTNLLTNAIKYSPKGKKIMIGLNAEKKRVIVSIQDFGIGIDKNQQKRIFERLYQVTDPNGQNFPGLGMGLYISKEIIKRHRGSIWVEGELGAGSTFYFSLPLPIKK